MSLTIGDIAPHFELFDTNKQKQSLTDYLNKNLVLLFFPQAFSGVCTNEMCSFRDSLADYNDLNCNVVAISVDSIFTQAKFKEINSLNFDLLSDFNKEVAPAYGAFYENWVFEMRGVARRAAFVIDKTGAIRYAEVLESAGDLPNFEAIKETVAAIN
ncbi:MAG: redoxin domain-containing protein [Sphingobacteriales bacterium]|jgi:peroxiredoxin|nr:redoxin domain-containing protein [Sphingobacteriales bacterium]MBP9140260.1 redoxin domain-containing protein [Chitinophagales bacterium]MDA0197606.1 redoxin domain-containing protein [Bacteroidota bacterium]MBK7528461.1 redoxin domain-containing protein [Sphingobacteriales bacterium]MBK8679574.1 redoxin domain-containing protein [Sphingobacteriales bacterium]